MITITIVKAYIILYTPGMIGFNHALAGALIGKILPWPIAIPAALASHFLLDMLPHYGIQPGDRNSSQFWKYFFTIDFFSALGLAFWAFKYHHYAMYASGQIAVIPDFVWVFHVLKHRSYDFTEVKSRYEKWHIRIQRFEFSKGLLIELPLAAVLFYIVILQTK